MRTTHNDHLLGKRVRLVHCSDPYTLLKAGDEGTVDFVDDFGTVHVRWDNGSLLGLVQEAGDSFVLIGQE